MTQAEWINNQFFNESMINKRITV